MQKRDYGDKNHYSVTWKRTLESNSIAPRKNFHGRKESTFAGELVFEFA